MHLDEMLRQRIQNLPLFRIHIRVQLIGLFHHHTSGSPLMKLPQKLFYKLLVEKAIPHNNIPIQIRPDCQVIDFLFAADMMDIKRIPNLGIGLFRVCGAGKHHHIITCGPGCPVDSIQRIHNQRMCDRRRNYPDFSDCVHTFPPCKMQHHI